MVEVEELASSFYRKLVSPVGVFVGATKGCALSSGIVSILTQPREKMSSLSSSSLKPNVDVKIVLAIVESYQREFSAKNFGKCVELSNKLLSGDDRAQFYLYRIKANYYLNRYEKVIQDTKKALLKTNVPKTVRAQIFLYQGCASVTKSPKLAKQALLKATELDPKTSRSDVYKACAPKLETDSKARLTSSARTHFSTDVNSIPGRTSLSSSDKKRNQNGVSVSQSTFNVARLYWFLSDILSLVVSFKSEHFSCSSPANYLKECRSLNECRRCVQRLYNEIEKQGLLASTWGVNAAAWMNAVARSRSLLELHLALRTLYRAINPEMFETKLSKYVENAQQYVFKILADGDTALSLPHGCVLRLCMRIVCDILLSRFSYDIVWLLDAHARLTGLGGVTQADRALLKDEIDPILVNFVSLDVLYYCSNFSFIENAALPPSHLSTNKADAVIPQDLKTRILERLGNQDEEAFSYQPPIIDDVESGFRPWGLVTELEGLLSTTTTTPIPNACCACLVGGVEETKPQGGACDDQEALVKVWNHANAEEKHRLGEITMEDLGNAPFNHVFPDIPTTVRVLEYYRSSFYSKSQHSSYTSSATLVDGPKEHKKQSINDRIANWEKLGAKFRQAMLVVDPCIADLPTMEYIPELIELRDSIETESMIDIMSKPINQPVLFDEDVVYVDNDSASTMKKDAAGLPLSLLRTEGIFVTNRCAELCHGCVGPTLTQVGNVVYICECGSMGKKCVAFSSVVPKVRKFGKENMLVEEPSRTNNSLKTSKKKKKKQKKNSSGKGVGAVPPTPTNSGGETMEGRCEGCCSCSVLAPLTTHNSKTSCDTCKMPLRVSSPKAFIPGLLDLEGNLDVLMHSIKNLSGGTDLHLYDSRRAKLLEQTLQLLDAKNGCIFLAGIWRIYKTLDKAGVANRSSNGGTVSHKSSEATKHLVMAVQRLSAALSKSSLLEILLDGPIVAAKFKQQLRRCEEFSQNVAALEASYLSLRNESQATVLPVVNSKSFRLNQILQQSKSAGSNAREKEKVEKELDKAKEHLETSNTGFVDMFLGRIKQISEDVLVAAVVHNDMMDSNGSKKKAKKKKKDWVSVQVESILCEIPVPEAQTIKWKHEQFLGDDEAVSLSFEERRRISQISKTIRRQSQNDLKELLHHCKSCIVCSNIISPVVAGPGVSSSTSDQVKLQKLEELYVETLQLVGFRGVQNSEVADVEAVYQRIGTLVDTTNNDVQKLKLALLQQRAEISHTLQLKTQLLYSYLAKVVVHRLRDRIERDRTNEQVTRDLLKQEDAEKKEKMKKRRKKEKKTPQASKEVAIPEKTAIIDETMVAVLKPEEVVRRDDGNQLTPTTVDVVSNADDESWTVVSRIKAPRASANVQTNETKKKLKTKLSSKSQQKQQQQARKSIAPGKEEPAAAKTTKSKSVSHGKKNQQPIKKAPTAGEGKKESSKVGKSAPSSGDDKLKQATPSIVNRKPKQVIPRNATEPSHTPTANVDLPNEAPEQVVKDKQERLVENKNEAASDKTEESLDIGDSVKTKAAVSEEVTESSVGTADDDEVPIVTNEDEVVVNQPTGHHQVPEPEAASIVHNITQANGLHEVEPEDYSNGNDDNSEEPTSECSNSEHVNQDVSEQEAPHTGGNQQAQPQGYVQHPQQPYPGQMPPIHPPPVYQMHPGMPMMPRQGQPPPPQSMPPPMMMYPGPVPPPRPHLQPQPPQQQQPNNPNVPGVCRYFLDGSCRYGNRCRFRHLTAVELYDMVQGGNAPPPPPPMQQQHQQQFMYPNQPLPPPPYYMPANFGPPPMPMPHPMAHPGPLQPPPQVIQQQQHPPPQQQQPPAEQQQTVTEEENK